MHFLAIFRHFLALSCSVFFVSVYALKEWNPYLEEAASQFLLSPTAQEEMNVASLNVLNLLNSAYSKLLPNGEPLRIHIYGSHRLNASIKGSDVDILCIIPSVEPSIDPFAEKFIETIKELVASMNNDYIHGLKFINAATPVLRIHYKRVSFDILSYGLPSNLMKSKLIQYEEIKSLIFNGPDSRPDLRRLNGYRNTEYLLQVVPNTAVFSKTLQYLKIWAVRRGIYNGTIGYFNGISLAVLLAKVHKMSGNISTFSLLYIFFQYYSKYNWFIPVSISGELLATGLPHYYFSWTPQSQSPGRRLTVLAPLYPYTSLMMTATLSTSNLMIHELILGFKHLETIKDFRSRTEINTVKPFLLFSPTSHLKEKYPFLVSAIALKCESYDGAFRQSSLDDISLYAAQVESRIFKTFYEVISMHLNIDLLPFAEIIYVNLTATSKDDWCSRIRKSEITCVQGQQMYYSAVFIADVSALKPTDIPMLNANFLQNHPSVAIRNLSPFYNENKQEDSYCYHFQFYPGGPFLPKFISDYAPLATE